MAPRGEVLLEITFGPSKSFVLPRAVSYASEHANEVAEVHPGIWRASFSLFTNEAAYAFALQLLYMVQGWRATILQVNGSPEPRRIARQMLECARRWLQTEHRCQAPLPPSGFAKCRICPLFDPEWAAESYVGPELAIGGPEGPFWADPNLKIPDYLPDEWEEPGGGRWPDQTSSAPDSSRLRPVAYHETSVTDGTAPVPRQARRLTGCRRRVDSLPHPLPRESPVLVGANCRRGYGELPEARSG